MKRAADSEDRVVADPLAPKGGVGMPSKQLVRRFKNIAGDRVVPGFDVDRDDLPDVLFGFDLRFEAPIVNLSAKPADLITRVTRVGHGRILHSPESRSNALRTRSGSRWIKAAPRRARGRPIGAA